MKKTLAFAAALFMTGAMLSCSGKSEKNNENCAHCTASTAQNDATEAVIENIMTRTSIRQFTDRAISKDTLDLLVRAGMAAPTAVNAQPWAFVIITDKEILNRLNELKPWFNLKTATAAIVVCGDMSKAIEGPGREYWVQDCSAATENILLAAHAYGLGAVWCGVYPGEELVKGVSSVLDLPENIIPLNVITLGYPDENPEPKDKFKTENIHYQKW